MREAEMQQFRVVVNHEEQYSLWPEGKENAVGWRNAGFTGVRAQCLAYIRKVWIDMRPLSLRNEMMESACVIGK